MKSYACFLILLGRGIMKKENKDGVLLASGGLDSTTLAYWLVDKGIDYCPLFVNYGQHCHDTELDTLRSVLPNSHKTRIEIVNVSDVYRYSPSRLIKEADLWKDHVSYKDMY